MYYSEGHAFNIVTFREVCSLVRHGDLHSAYIFDRALIQLVRPYPPDIVPDEWCASLYLPNMVDHHIAFQSPDLYASGAYMWCELHPVERGVVFQRLLYAARALRAVQKRLRTGRFTPSYRARGRRLVRVSVRARRAMRELLRSLVRQAYMWREVQYSYAKGEDFSTQI
ncbi:hypothetical protein PENSPDRAFT_755714 [Peniophora sp. CONT]|nr:hypothetical protein PENSPDRAFT_755714 [Peniophora sp. CONT]